MKTGKIFLTPHREGKQVLRPFFCSAHPRHIYYTGQSKASFSSFTLSRQQAAFHLGPEGTESCIKCKINAWTGKVTGGDKQITLPPNGGKLYRNLLVEYIYDAHTSTWTPSTVFANRHPALTILQNTAREQTAARRYPLCTVRGHFACSLLSLSTSHEFSTLRLLNFHMH